MKKFLLFLCISIFIYSYAQARPQYSIIQSFGARCTSCHVNIQGGGVRNNPGFLSRSSISLIPPESIGLGGVFSTIGETNSYLDDKILFGLDFRYQNAKWPKGSKTERDFMVMQLSPYLVISPFEWLDLEAFYNLAYEIDNRRYPGQQPGAASAIIKFGEDLPQLRVGYFQPPIGIKWDDHTMLIRNVIGGSTGKQGREPLIPDDYAELGAQLDYAPTEWLEVSAGLFQAKNYPRVPLTQGSGENSQRVEFIDANSYSTALRAFVTPPDFGTGLTLFGGGTLLINRDAYISSIFLNFGLPGYFAIMSEYVRSQKEDSRLTLNFSVEAIYQLHEALLPFARAERGIAKYKNNNDPSYVNQYVFGAHIFLLPFIELLPEYRILDREVYESYNAQWAFQLHVFY